MKIYVKVIVEISETGMIMPMSIIWEDGRRFDISRILDYLGASSTRAGGKGITYTCEVHGKTVHLFYEDDQQGRWYVERNAA